MNYILFPGSLCNLKAVDIPDVLKSAEHVHVSYTLVWSGMLISFCLFYLFRGDCSCVWGLLRYNFNGTIYSIE